MGCRRIAPGIPSIPLLLALALPGCGGAGFNTPFTIYTSIASADLNGDGRLDIAMSCAYLSGPPPHPGYAVVLLQNPVPADGFSPPVRHDTGNDPDFLLVGDIDGDGKPDLVVADQTPSAKGEGTNSISVLLQDPGNPGVFLPAANYPGISQPLSVAIADLNGDGNADIAVADGGALIYYQDPVRHGIFFSPVRAGT